MLGPSTTLQNGRYRITRCIGEGGMGAVYEAYDNNLRNRVALKEALVSEPTLLRAFEHEAQRLDRLRHVALPTVKDHFTEGDGQYLVMEYIDGEDLGKMLKQRKQPFPVADVLAWADTLLEALAYLHQEGVIHRDIKPANIKLTPKGQIILLDFGLAKGGVTQQTVGGRSLYGYTPGYAPPEQIEGEPTDERSDLYALAATLYVLLTGEKPDDSISRRKYMKRGLPDLLLPANQVNDQVSPHIAQALQQAMALEPTERPKSALQMRAMLNAPHTQPLALPVSTLPPSSDDKPPQPAQITSPSPPIGKQAAAFESVETENGGNNRIFRLWGAIMAAILIVGVLVTAYIVGDNATTSTSTTSQDLAAQAAATQAAAVEAAASQAAAAEATAIQAAANQATATQVAAANATAANEAVTEATAIQIAVIQAAAEATAIQVAVNQAAAEATSIQAAATQVAATQAAATQAAVTLFAATQVAANNVTATQTASIPFLEPGATAIAQKDGMVQVYVPAGEFEMGSADDDPDARNDEKPRHTVYLDAFWMDQTEVTNAMFANFLNEMGNQVEGDVPVTWLEEEDEGVLIEQANEIFQPKSGFAHHPVVAVSWYGANAYCQWAERRLSTEAEWEKAAGGVLTTEESRKWPWGNEEPNNTLANFNFNETSSVRNYPAGTSPYGAYDMAGNVSEWVLDSYDPNYYANSARQNAVRTSTDQTKVFRGGAWNNGARHIRVQYRFENQAYSRVNFLGFRCAQAQN